MTQEKLRILYVEDRPNEVDGIIKMLKKDFEVILEEKSENVSQKLRDSPFDIVILDYDMVGQENADKILKKIRKENYHIRVLLITALLREVHELADVINQGISKCYFKDDLNLADKLKKGILEIVNNRDTIIQGLETWIQAREINKDKPLLVSGNKSYSASELLKEIKKNSKIGKLEITALVSLAIKLLQEDNS